MLKKLLEVSCTGSYEDNGKRKMLDKGDETNKGVINIIIYDIHARYNTNQGSFMADELKIIKYKKENISKIITNYF